MTQPERSTHAANNAHSRKNAIELQLSRLVASKEFSRSPRLQQLLSYLVVETLHGRSERIKGVTIAQDVFGQTDPEVAQTSTVVSVEARRLRRKLADYYRVAGTNDPVIIEIPKGTFVPVFRDVSTLIVTPGAKESPTKRRRMGVYLTILVALAANLSILSILLWNSNSQISGSSGYALKQPAIAVMPFRNATGSPLNDAFAAGLTEDITTDLARLNEIDVISYSSTILLRDQNLTPDEIGKTLKVSHVLQGSVRGTAPTFRINVELMDARSAKLIWANRLDRNFEDPLGLQNEIAGKVLEGMSIGISSLKQRGRKAGRSKDPEAEALFRQAIELANPPSDFSRLKIAQLAFDAVIKADPDYAGGYAGVAYVNTFKALWGHVPKPQVQAKNSVFLAQKALEIDPNSTLALDALALSKLILRDFDAAVRLSAQAIEVAPNDAYAHAYHGFILSANGQATAAIPFAEKAVRLDPLEPRTPYLNILGVVQLHAGNYAAALQSLLESERRGGPQSAGHIAHKAAAFAGLGEREKAAELVATLPPGFVEGPWLDWQKRSFRYSADALLLPELLAELAANN